MSIMRNLQKVHVAVVTDTFNDSTARMGKQLSERAVQALTKGLGSAEWNTYMSLFADNAEQLRRLTKVQESDEEYFAESRAYIVANAVCGAGTTTQTGQGVDIGFSKVRPGLDSAQFDVVDPQFIAAERPFAVPEPKP